MGFYTVKALSCNHLVVKNINYVFPNSKQYVNNLFLTKKKEKKVNIWFPIIPSVPRPCATGKNKKIMYQC